MDAYIRAVAFLSRVAGVVAAFLIFFAVLVICDIVVERYILNLTTIWQIDVVTYCIVGATFVGSAYVLMTRGHVNVDILPLHVKPRMRFWLALFDQLVGAGILHRHFRSLHGVLVRGLFEALAFEHCVAREAMDSYLSMPVGLGLLVLQYVAESAVRDYGAVATVWHSRQAGCRGCGARAGA